MHAAHPPVYLGAQVRGEDKDNVVLNERYLACSLGGVGHDGLATKGLDLRLSTACQGLTRMTGIRTIKPWQARERLLPLLPLPLPLRPLLLQLPALVLALLPQPQPLPLRPLLLQLPALSLALLLPRPQLVPVLVPAQLPLSLPLPQPLLQPCA